jgi:protoporphyrinogen oxidase
VAIRYSAAVRKIFAEPKGGLELSGETGTERFDLCLATSSPHQFADMAPGLPAEYLAKLRALRHMGAVVMVFSMTRQLSTKGVYWHNLPKEAGFPFLAMVEHTNFLSTEHFGGDHIVYCGDYLPLGHEYFRLSKDELAKRFLAVLPRFNPEFQASWVKKSWLFKTEYAQPVPGLFHSRNIPDVRTPQHGLYFASMSQVYPWDRGMNYAVRLARDTAKKMMRENKEKKK